MLKIKGALLVSKRESRKMKRFLDSLPEHNEDKYKKDYEEAKKALARYNDIK